MTENGGLQAWATSRIAAWGDLGSILDGLERKRDHTVTETLRAIELYRALGRDLSIVRRTLPASRMTRALAQSYALEVARFDQDDLYEPDVAVRFGAR